MSAAAIIISTYAMNLEPRSSCGPRVRLLFSAPDILARNSTRLQHKSENFDIQVLSFGSQSRLLDSQGPVGSEEARLRASLRPPPKLPVHRKSGQRFVKRSYACSQLLK